MNHEFPDVQVVFRKGRRTRDQIANTPALLALEWLSDRALTEVTQLLSSEAGIRTLRYGF